jgi:hypothetical protein
MATFNVGWGATPVEVKTNNENETKILHWCASLSQSQGFYGRLFEYLASEDGAEELAQLAEQNFKNAIDFVLYIEQ